MRKKPEAEDRFRQILKVAHLFYEKEMTKTDISHEIRASTTQVARLLEEARELGFVRVEFTPPRLHELGEQLRGKYAWLRDATVISYAEDLVFLHAGQGGGGLFLGPGRRRRDGSHRRRRHDV
jgi:DNA-binding transcriptional regulator LsrR (DeoR family)